ncbi:penicillin-binding protein 1C [Uliginosibacterium flavum]|uniref:peptidoglycan glycosyltransferase n=1 Tax=Uliginosibacterium flavum TaxID=1396831 RepID=A0ABV2TFU9_9RHOO
MTASLLRSIQAWLRRHPLRAALAALLTLALLLDQCFPPPIPRDEPGLVVVAEDGSPLRSWPSADGVWRYPVTPEQVSPLYLQALLNYEDRWFYRHPGVNPVALLRAAVQWVRHGHIVSGGSTLTMQVARLIDPPGRSIPGKLRQILRALQLEARLSKQEILTLYLNHAPMGGIVEGVEMASRMYLGKPSAHLTHAEAALLVVLPQAPSRLRPDRAASRAQLARDKVLLRMAELEIWDPVTVTDARLERVGANPLRPQWLAPLAAERLRQQGRKQRNTGKLAVLRSTLNPEMQSTLERMLLDRIEQLPPKVSMAAIVMESDSLAIRAYAGSADFSDGKRFNHVDMVRGVRSPGSTLKPFLYALALDEGLIHSESLLADAPQSFAGYEPGNFQANFSGPVSVSEALQRSLNVPAVDLLDRLGPQRFASQLRSGGLRLRLPAGGDPNLSIILGGAGSTLEDLVGAYRALATKGLAGVPRLSPEAPRSENRIMSEGAAFIVRDILESGGHPDRPFVEDGGRRIAWKTGTSFGFRDAWALGVSGHYTIGVWIGRPDGTPNPGFFGANVAAPLLHDIVSALPAGTPPPRAKPANVGTAQICWPLGTAVDATPAELCPHKRTAWTLNGAIPPTLPDRASERSLRETIWLDPASGLRSTPFCTRAAIQREIAHWPTYLEPWISADELARLNPAWLPDCPHNEANTGSLKLQGIARDAQIRPSPGKNVAQIDLRAAGGTGTLYWLLDGKLLRAAAADQGQRIELRENGEHNVTVMDAQGHYASARFMVKGF